MEKENATFITLSDESIAMIRELLQLCLITGDNFVDSLRAMKFSFLNTEDSSKLYPAPEYVEGYNEYVKKLTARAEEEAVKILSSQSRGETDLN